MKYNNFILNYMAFKYLTMACKSCSSITIPFKDYAFFEMASLHEHNFPRLYIKETYKGCLK
jgi:hypothetical protein